MIALGEFEPLDVRNPSVLVYKRLLEGEELLVICNFYGKEISWSCGENLESFRCLLVKLSGTED